MRNHSTRDVKSWRTKVLQAVDKNRNDQSIGRTPTEGDTVRRKGIHTIHGLDMRLT